MINIDDISQHLLTMTQLRRRPGEVFQKLPEVGMYIVLRNGKQVGRILPIEKKMTKEEIEKNIEKLHKLAGGFRLGKHLNPVQLNRLYDKQYDEMLP